jgi:hypothetical protein
LSHSTATAGFSAIFLNRRSLVVDLGLWSMEVTMRSSTTANVTGTMCGCRSAPTVARYPTRAAVIRSRHAC